MSGDLISKPSPLNSTQWETAGEVIRARLKHHVHFNEGLVWVRLRGRCAIEIKGNTESRTLTETGALLCQ